MPQHQELKNSLYKRQANYMYMFLAVFCLLTIAYSEHVEYASIHALLNITFVYTTSILQEKESTRKFVRFSLLANTFLPVLFATLVGNESLVWLFNVITIFQAIFLLPATTEQVTIIVIAIVNALLSSYIQDIPSSTLISRGLILTSVSSFSLNAVNNLLRSQEALRHEVIDNKLLNLELQSVRTFQRQVLDSTKYAIIAFDLQGRITEFNKGAEELLGYSNKEAIGQLNPTHLFLPKELEKRTQELNSKYNARLNPGVDTLVYKSKIGLQNTGEWTFLHADGTQLRVQLTINNLNEKGGKVTGHIMVAMDITERKASEEKQQTAETIISNSSNVLLKWLPDEQWTLKYVSANVIQVLGYSSIELTNGGISYASLLEPSDLNLILNETNQALIDGKENLHFEYRLKHKNGNYIWVEERTFIKRNVFGEIEYYEGILSDITTRKEAETKLKQSELRYELAATGIAAGIWDWVDINKDAEWWSPKFFELLGYENNEIDSSLSSFAKLLHPDDAAKTYEELENHLNYNIPYKVEYRLKTKSGAYKWFLGSGQASRDKNGKPTRMVGSIIDIDQNKRSEDLLKLSEERFRMLIESASDIFYQTDSRGRVTYANEAALNITGYNPQELIGKHFTELVVNDYKKLVFEFYNQQAKKKEVLSYHEFPILNKAGVTTWVGQNVKFTIENGNITGTIAVARDITVIRVAQEKLNQYTQNLERINHELEDFAHIVSHDLKTPIKNVMQLQKLIKEEHASWISSNTALYFEHAENSLKKITNFIERLLEYARVNKRNYPTERIQLTSMVSSLTKELGYPQNIKLIIDLPGMEIETDAVYLRKILHRLLENSLVHNTQLTTVRVSGELNGDKIKLCIEDDGSGIEEIEQPKLFQPYKTTQDGDAYTGLGLVIVKKIIDNKKESITLTSQKSGTKIDFTWPIELLTKNGNTN